MYRGAGKNSSTLEQHKDFSCVADHLVRRSIKDERFGMMVANALKSDPNSAHQLVQMGVDTIEQVYDGVLTYSKLVSKLKGILMWSDYRSELVTDESSRVFMMWEVNATGL